MLMINAHTTDAVRIERLFNIHDRLVEVQRGFEKREYGKGIAGRSRIILGREIKALGAIKEGMDEMMGKGK